MKVRLEVDGESFDVLLDRTAAGFRVECEDEAFEARSSGANPVTAGGGEVYSASFGGTGPRGPAEPAVPPGASGPRPVRVVVEANGRRHVVDVRGDHEALFDGRAVRFHVARFEPGSSGLRAGHVATMNAMMTGRLVKVLVESGDAVKKGQPLFVLESMKMQNELVSPADAVVQEILVREGETIEAGRGLAKLGPAR